MSAPFDRLSECSIKGLHEYKRRLLAELRFAKFIFSSLVVMSVCVFVFLSTPWLRVYIL